MRFLVRVYFYRGNDSAMAPDLPGCVAAGDTVEDTLALMAEAMRGIAPALVGVY